ncbi:MAG: hypothetical protein COT74_04860 [Bdellovibrionales bacterium CG10_big_fil_rev_8_21_14_0_10_45_34]|nr:MAG: hypothetical protein COT74_04860 [Bdellovibrionales bacterium CG10_big_fil_rev_8_21_14_0_10_45_34]
MEKGFNTDVTSNGIRYHVQTEDWGTAKGFIATTVFRGGAVLRTYKRSYAQITEDIGYRTPSQVLRLVMREQHQKILDLLLSGQELSGNDTM